MSAPAKTLLAIGSLYALEKPSWPGQFSFAQLK